MLIDKIIYWLEKQTLKILYFIGVWKDVRTSHTVYINPWLLLCFCCWWFLSNREYYLHNNLVMVCLTMEGFAATPWQNRQHYFNFNSIYLWLSKYWGRINVFLILAIIFWEARKSYSIDNGILMTIVIRETSKWKYVLMVHQGCFQSHFASSILIQVHKYMTTPLFPTVRTWVKVDRYLPLRCNLIPRSYENYTIE